MTVHSGRWAVVDGQSTVRNWSINDTQSAARFVASNTLAGTGRRKSIRQWNGSFNSYGAVPLVMPGSSFTFTGYTAPTTGNSGTGVTYAGTAFVDQVSITWDWASGAILAMATNFSGHMALVKGTGSPTDATDPEVPSICGTKITYVDEEDEDIEIENLTQATLTLNCPSQAYVNSSTIDSGVCWTGRKPGVFDWTLALTEQNHDRVSALEIGNDLDLKLWVDDTEFWRLKWGHVEGYSGLTLNRETGALIQRTVNIGMNGFVGGEVGQVTLPGAVSNYWPLA